MKNLLALIGLVVVVFLVGGAYFGWYSFSSRTGLDGRSQYQFDVDTNKIKDDARHAAERVGGAAAPAAKPAPALAPLPPGVMGPPAPVVATQPAKGPEAGFTPEGGFEIRLPPRR